ncbi:MAG: bifunctional demethylmenaquinone methyltransferase/2-methoxy-6-polyprenyl-1,4-benzoquinol methylase UbiE [Xanthomonadales bacterium]|nr:bifunctional demethylmenaquinone methyltransferase/2-methoxy-6-polyprenyl-1,4-benzoquinol methylase UbiE [Xanthomonadales bacterium]
MSELEHPSPTAEPAQTQDGDTTHFGYQQVSPEEKTRRVKGVFDSVAGRYDIMNDLMSMGIHRIWKRDFIGTSGIRPGATVLDLAGGTGDIARLLLRKVGPLGRVILSDINAAMLNVGRRRLEDEGTVRGVDYVLINAESLPLPDQSVDAITMAFGLRNVTDKQRALNEMHRILKPGGKALILEFSKVQPGLVSRLYDTYSFQILPRLGAKVADDADSYQYLAESIRQHPPQAELAAMMEKAGMVQVGWRNLSHGICAIHKGYRV